MARAVTRLQSCFSNFLHKNGVRAQLLGSSGSFDGGPLMIVGQQKVYSSSSSRNSSKNSDLIQQRSASTDAGPAGSSTTLKESLPSEGVFYHPKHDMYVCWHPEVPFPYEMSKPIPTEVPLTNQALKIQSLVPVKEVFRKKNERLILRELMQLTYTTKHRWLGKYGRKKKYVIQDMDPLKQKRNREYL